MCSLGNVAVAIEVEVGREATAMHQAEHCSVYVAPRTERGNAVPRIQNSALRRQCYSFTDYGVLSRRSIIRKSPTRANIREDAVGFVVGGQEEAKVAATRPAATRCGKVGSKPSGGGPATGPTSKASENCECPRPFVAGQH